MALREGIEYLPLLDGHDPGGVLAALAAICHSVMGHCLPGDRAGNLLRDIGLSAARAASARP